MLKTELTPADETDVERIDAVLADLGAIARRNAHGSLTEEDFLTMTRRSRERLLHLRETLLDRDEPAIVLTDAGMAAAVAAAAGAAGQRPEIRELIRRVPALMTAQQLAENPSVNRARFYGPLAAIDGGRP